MRISFYRNKYRVRCNNNYYVDTLDVVNLLTDNQIEQLAEVEKVQLFKLRLKTFLDMKSRKYNFDKLFNILSDGIFSFKVSGGVSLSEAGSSYVKRLKRINKNYEDAEQLGIECQLKNKLLEKENDKNEANILGL